MASVSHLVAPLRTATWRACCDVDEMPQVLSWRVAIIVLLVPAAWAKSSDCVVTARYDDGREIER